MNNIKQQSKANERTEKKTRKTEQQKKKVLFLLRIGYKIIYAVLLLIYVLHIRIDAFTSPLSA